MRSFILGLLILIFATATGCDKTQFYPEEKPEEIVKVVPVPSDPAKNSFQLRVDSLVAVGKLQVGEPYGYKRWPGDDVTYDINEGYSWRGTTTKKYVQENVWAIIERYSDQTGYFYVKFHHNNHDQWFINNKTNFTRAMYDSAEFAMNSVLSGSRVFELLDKQYGGVWDPEVKPPGR